MKNFRSNKGSITLFVLLSCLFFLVLVTSTTIYVKNKSIAQDSQYQQIKEKYAKRPVEIASHPNSDTETDTTFSTNYGRIDVIWLDTNNKVISNPNEPILTYESNSMDAVIYDESISDFVKTADKAKGKWYDYNGEKDGDSVVQGNRWANAITANGSYFVWIPRYAYRITYYESETSTEPTGYYDGYGQWNASTLELRLKLDEGIETVDYNGEKYIVHPAFCDNTSNNFDNGGWSSNISGFWCAKYEASEGTGSTLQFVPDVESWRSQTIGTQYATAINATYGYTVSNANTDGIRSFMYSHMMKNSEWGAVAYLTQSKYGRNGKEIDINNSSDYITGNGGGAVGGSVNYDSGTTNAYNTVKGVKASTTGNVYGIYDMSGGAWEKVALFNSKDYSGYFKSNGWETVGNIAGIKNTVNSETKLTSSTSTKYATKYDNKTTSYYGNSIIYTVGKIGDATKEVNTGGSQSLSNTSRYSNWFSDYYYLTRSDYPFAGRGGGYDFGSNAGIFCAYDDSGNSYSNNSFRAVLVP